MNRVTSVNPRPPEIGRNTTSTHMSKHCHVLFATLALLAVALTTPHGFSGETTAEAPRERNAADCASPLAKYDSNRELGLGEAKPEEPDQPLRRFLYLNMQDSSEETFSRGGIVVLDLDNNLRFVKRIGSEMMMKGATSPNSLGGVRWQHGSAITDRLYYGYWQPGTQFMQGLNPAAPIPENANAVVGCLDLRTDQTLWEQPTYNACATVVFPDGKRLLSLPHWSQRKYGKLTILDAITGDILRTIDAQGCHGGSIGRSGRYIYPEDWVGPLPVLDTATLKVVPMTEAFGLLDLAGWDVLPAEYKTFKSNTSYNDTLRANGREDLFWSQVRNWRPPLTSMGGQMTFDVANRRVAFSPVNAGMIGNAIDPDCARERKTAWFHYVYDNSISADERWFYHGPNQGDMRVTVWDNTVWPPRHVGIMGEGLSSRKGYGGPFTAEDPVSGGPLGNGNKSGAWTSLDNTRVYTSDSWYFDAKTWKPMGLMRGEKGQVIRCSKMNEVYFRSKDCVHFGQRYGYGRFQEPAKVFPPSTDKTPPTAIAGLKATVGEPAPRWAGGAIVVAVKLTGSAATDNEGVQRYAIWRDGELIGNCLGVNPGIDPVMSPEDQAEYERQAGPFEPNSFKARYLEPGKTYKFEVEPIDFAQNRGPRSAITVEVPAVSDDRRLALVRERLAYLVERALAHKTDRDITTACVTAAMGLVALHRPPPAEVLAALDRLGPLAAGDDREAQAIKRLRDMKRKELSTQTPLPKEGRR